MSELNRVTHISFPDMQDTSLHDITTGIAEGSLSLEEILLAGNLVLGECNANKFEVQLYGIADVADQRIIVTVVENEGTPQEETIPIFVGWVDSCKLDNLGYYRSIVAYDALYYLGDMNVAGYWTHFWESVDGASTIKEFRDYLCAEIADDINGFYYSDDPVPNDDFEIVKAANFVDVKFSEMLKYICEIQCTIPHMSRAGVLEFISLNMNETPTSVVDLYRQADSEFEDFTTARVDGVQIDNDDSGGISAFTYAKLGRKTNYYTVKDNLFLFDCGDDEAGWAKVWDIKDFLESKIASSNFTYRPCKLSMIVSDLGYRLGQKIATSKGNTFILKQTLSGSFFVEQTLEAGGDKLLTGKTTNAAFKALRTQTADIADNAASGFVNYQYTNFSEYTIRDEYVRIIRITLISGVESSATFLANINVDSTQSGDDPVIVQVQYRMRNLPLEFSPVDTYAINGTHLLSLFYPIESMPDNMRFSFDVYMKVVSGGTAHIGIQKIIASLLGQKMTGGIPKWDGILEFTEELENIRIPAIRIAQEGISDNVIIAVNAPTPVTPTDQIPTMPVPYTSIESPTDSVTIAFIIVSATIDTNSTVTRNTTYTAIVNNQFTLVTEYVEESTVQRIDTGYCTKVTPFVTGLTISSMEIEEE